MRLTDAKNYYNQISSGYEELHREEQERKLAIIKRELSSRIKKNHMLLDVGCGTGITSDFDCRVFGADPALKLLRKSLEKSKPDFSICAEAERLPFKDNSFDAVVSVTALQNFRDTGKGLDEIKRVGKERCVYALSFLKSSAKKESMINAIKGRFSIKKEIEEDKDMLLFCW